MKTILVVSRDIVRVTVEELQQAGHAHRERVVLWLGRQKADTIAVETVFGPIQEAAQDYFHIPRVGMVALLAHLREYRLMVAAQVHSHPDNAFHSRADDAWAIVRHVGALSLVLPFFGLQTSVETFVHDAAVFELLPDNHWYQVPSSQVPSRYRVQP